jgi:hypothetical protein
MIFLRKIRCLQSSSHSTTQEGHFRVSYSYVAAPALEITVSMALVFSRQSDGCLCSVHMNQQPTA